MDRAKKLKIALAFSGTTTTALAESNGVSQGLISQAITNARKSKRANQIIDTFIAEQFAKLRLSLASERRPINGACSVPQRAETGRVD